MHLLQSFCVQSAVSGEVGLVTFFKESTSHGSILLFCYINILSRGHQRTSTGESFLLISIFGMRLSDSHRSDGVPSRKDGEGRSVLIGPVPLSHMLSWFWALPDFVSWRALCSGASFKSAALSEIQKPSQLLDTVSSRVHPLNPESSLEVSLLQGHITCLALASLSLPGLT